MSKKVIQRVDKPDRAVRVLVESAKVDAYRADLYNEDKRIIICEGIAHTGKTYNAVVCGASQVIQRKYQKLVIVRPVMQNAFGFLPGDAEDKMAFLIRQAKEYVNEASLFDWESLAFRGWLEILPADQLQGNHFDDCFVIIDEAQNIPKSETFKVMSRLGSKFVITGDTSKGQENVRFKADNMLRYLVSKESFMSHPAVVKHSFMELEDVLGMI